MSCPWATDDQPEQNNAGLYAGKRGAPRGATSCMKNILYGGEGVVPTDPVQGKRQQSASTINAPFASGYDAQENVRNVLNRPGDKGDKFAVGAEKIGDLGKTASRQCFDEAQHAAMAARERNRNGMF